MMDFIQMYPIGRFGNQLFQYAFLKAYSEKYGLELQIPSDWVGRQIFDIHDEPVKSYTRVCRHKNFNLGVVNRAVKAQFIEKRYTDLLTRDYCRKVLPIQKRWLDDDISYWCAAHLRRGDYQKERNKRLVGLITIDSYKRAFKKYGYDEKDVIWVSEERPVGADAQFPFLKDFTRMMHSKVLFRANSSFSLWAHVLADDSQKCYSPIMTGVGDIDVEFSPDGGQALQIGADGFDFAK